MTIGGRGGGGHTICQECHDGYNITDRGDVKY